MQRSLLNMQTLLYEDSEPEVWYRWVGESLFLGVSMSQPNAVGRDCLVTGHSSREVVTQGRSICQCWELEVEPVPGILLLRREQWPCASRELLQPVS